MKYSESELKFRIFDLEKKTLIQLKKFQPTAGRSEYGRVKVALPKGKGLMDWVRLTSGKVGISHIENSMQEEFG